MDLSHAAESFRGLVLRHRGRTGLTQRELAARLAVDRSTVQDWETGIKYPTARACLHVLRGDRRYQRLDITGLIGVTEAQRAALLALGATEGPPASGSRS